MPLSLQSLFEVENYYFQVSSHQIQLENYSHSHMILLIFCESDYTSVTEIYSDNKIQLMYNWEFFFACSFQVSFRVYHKRNSIILDLGMFLLC